MGAKLFSPPRAFPSPRENSGFDSRRALPNHSGGTAPDSHRLPLSPGAVNCWRDLYLRNKAVKNLADGYLENKPKHQRDRKNRYERAEHDNRGGDFGILTIFFRQNEIDNRGGQATVEKQHLAINTVSADQIRGEKSRRGAADDSDNGAAERMAPFQRLHVVQTIPQAY